MMPAGAHCQRGVALVLVLWVLVLVTIASGAYALMARMDQLEANALLSGTQARLSAEAAITLMAMELRDPDDLVRPVADGRPYQYEFDGCVVQVRVTDERGKLDINVAGEDTLFTLFVNHGMAPSDAELLAAAVVDWIDYDDMERVNGAEVDAYLAAGLPVGPANRRFMMTDELLQVIGMPYELYRSIEPGISVYSRAGVPDLNFAPVEALMAIGDISREEAQAFVAQRHELDQESLTGLALPNGQAVVARGRGLTYSIEAVATMPNGVWETLEATIRLGTGPDGSPFQVLRWREGFHR
jgi:general secretion pathway protein K